MSRRTYRTELEIISNIFEVITEAGLNGAYITTIVKNANLSHNVALEKLKKLIKSNLVFSKEEEKNRLFAATENGIKFFRELQDFNCLVQSIRTDQSGK